MKKEKKKSVGKPIIESLENQSLERGLKDLKNILRNAAEKKIELTYEVVLQILSVFKEKSYIVNKLFLSVNVNSAKILLTIPEKQHYEESFMTFFYTLSSDLEDLHSKNGFNLHVSAINESPDLNTELLQRDGYTEVLNVGNVTTAVQQGNRCST